MGAPARQFPTSDIRNIVIVGHGGSGKTTLTDAMAYISGSTTRRGSVRSGNALTDFTPEEIEHGISIGLSVAQAQWLDTKLNLIDTPGYLDFLGETAAGIRVADGALVAVSAQAGVEVGTERVWETSAARGIPRMFFVSMMDRENASFERTFAQIKEVLSPNAIPVEIPIGCGDTFRGIVNLFSQKAHMYRPGAVRGEYDETDIPEELHAGVARYREELIETIASSDDDLLEAYLEGETLDRERVLAVLSAAMLRGELFPIFCGSAETGWGVRAVMNKLVELMPSPADAGPALGEDGAGEPIELEPSDEAPLSALVFKTAMVPAAGEVSYFRIFSGRLTSGQGAFNAARSSQERLAHLAVPNGAERHEIPTLHAGDIGIVAKLRDTHTGDTLSGDGRRVILESIEWPAPDISLAIRAASRGEEDKLANGLARLQEEDRAFRAAYEPEIGQTIARGLGELHLNIALERLQRKYGVKVVTEAPRIPYRETITRATEGHGKYKKQSGGRGQYGDCWLRLKPRQLGEGYEFKNSIVGGAIPGKFIPAVDKGVREAAARGVVAGYPLVDFFAECYDGSYHSVDSSEQAFKMAGSLGFQQAAKEAGPILLEPIVNLSVKMPDEFTGDVIGDLNQRRGRIIGVETHGHWQQVRAQVPLAELYKYSASLRSLTQGRGAHSREHAGYEPVPPHVAAKLVREAQAEKEAAAAH